MIDDILIGCTQSLVMFNNDASSCKSKSVDTSDNSARERERKRLNTTSLLDALLLFESLVLSELVNTEEQARIEKKLE